MSGQQLTASGPLHAAGVAARCSKSSAFPPTRRELARCRRGLLKRTRPRRPVHRSRRRLHGTGARRALADTRTRSIRCAAAVRRRPMMIGNTHDETRSLDRARRSGRVRPRLGSVAGAPRSRDARGHLRRVVAPSTAAVSALFAGDVFFAATTAGRSWRRAIVEAELARGAGFAGVLPTSSTGAHRRTAASGAPSTRSTSR
jgi:para-nitrobenzyl esterase